MTYQQLADRIALMTDEQKGMDATVHLIFMDECFPVTAIAVTTEDDESIAGALDPNHPVIQVQE